MSRTTTSQTTHMAGTPAQDRHALTPLRAAAGLLAAVTIAAIFLPMPDPRLPPAPVDGQAFWELPTGSRIAYVHLPPNKATTPSGPLVFLHGGPGVADMRTRLTLTFADRLSPYGGTRNAPGRRAHVSAQPEAAATKHVSTVLNEALECFPVRVIERDGPASAHLRRLSGA
jgi:hypothetical protein